MGFIKSTSKIALKSVAFQQSLKNSLLHVSLYRVVENLFIIMGHLVTWVGDIEHTSNFYFVISNYRLFDF